MDGRTWTLIGVLLLIACVAAGASYLHQEDAGKKELAGVKAEVEKVQAQIEEKLSTSAKTKESYERLKKLIDNYEGFTVKKKQLEQELAGMEEERTALLKTFKDTVAQVRNASAGMAWPDFNHSNGQTLHGVRIQRATESEVTISHSEGVLKLSGNSLTPELKARFRIGMVPVVEPAR